MSGTALGARARHHQRLGGQTAGVGLPGPHAEPVAATGSWSSTTTMDVDDDDDGLGVGQGGEDPIIGKVPATPLLVARNL